MYEIWKNLKKSQKIILRIPVFIFLKTFSLCVCSFPIVFVNFLLIAINKSPSKNIMDKLELVEIARINWDLYI